MKKKIVLLALALLMTGTASAFTLGTFQYQETKSTSGEPVEFTLGLVNLGDKDLRVEFQASNREKISLNLEENITVPPSEITSNPRGEGWYALENGSYVKVTRYSFDAGARNFRNRSFTLDILARSNETGQTSYKKVVQERSYEFTIINESYSEGLIDFEEEKRQNREKQKSQENLTIKPGEENRTQIAEKEKSSGLEPVTAVLAAGVLVSGAYLVKLVVL